MNNNKEQFKTTRGRGRDKTPVQRKLEDLLRAVEVGLSVPLTVRGLSASDARKSGPPVQLSWGALTCGLGNRILEVD